MARINIEDDLYKDNRFYNLCLLLGSKRTAIGALVEAWTVAQSHVSNENPEGTFSTEAWEAQELAPEIIKAKLANIKDGQITIVGARKNFAWIIQRMEAGKKGGRPKRLELVDEEITGRLAEVTGRVPEGTGSNPLTLTLPLPLSLSLTPSLAQSFNETSTLAVPKVTRRKTTATPEVESETKLASKATWEAYRDAYLIRYQVEPIRNARANTQIKQLVERLGAKDSPEIAKFYLGHNSARYSSSAHSVGNMLFDAEKLRTEWLRGKQITMAESRTTENKQQIVNVFSKYLEKEIS